METKYNLEKNIENGRGILDSVDKTHQREYKELSFEYFEESDYNNLVTIDISEYNYFYLDLKTYNYVDYFPGFIDFQIKNPNNSIKRFEILILGWGEHIFTENWLNSDGEVIFPHDIGLGHDVYLDVDRQKVISFYSFPIYNKMQYIGISSNWIRI